MLTNPDHSHHLLVVILDNNDASAALLALLDNQFDIEWLNGKGIDNTRRNAILLQLIGGSKAFVKRNAGTDE